MAILYGTQSNGETLPVLVDQFGNLLAKGIEGEPGTPGEPGEPGAPGAPGAPGGAFPLPPDPYEGAFLGWLNNELAWIGTPPIPVPEGRFGPITNWDPAGLLTVEGGIPQQVAKGVHVYQCNEDGTIYVDGWNTSQVWSDTVPYTQTETGDGSVVDKYKGFDGDITQRSYTEGSTLEARSLTIDLTGKGLSGAVRIYTFVNRDTDGPTLSLNGGSAVDSYNFNSGNTGGYNWVELGDAGTVETIVITVNANDSAYVGAIEINGAILVDAGDYPTAPNLNCRIQSVSGQTLLGVANRTDNFTIGKYLRVPEQNVARWLYDGNLIKVITSTGIDISRLTGN